VEPMSAPPSGVRPRSGCGAKPATVKTVNSTPTKSAFSMLGLRRKAAIPSSLTSSWAALWGPLIGKVISVRLARPGARRRIDLPVRRFWARGVTWNHREAPSFRVQMVDW
jgi:hypothetical protein